MDLSNPPRWAGGLGIWVLKISRFIDCLDVEQTSEIPKSPMTTGTRPTPSIRTSG